MRAVSASVTASSKGLTQVLQTHVACEGAPIAIASAAADGADATQRPVWGYSGCERYAPKRGFLTNLALPFNNQEVTTKTNLRTGQKMKLFLQSSSGFAKISSSFPKRHSSFA